MALRRNGDGVAPERRWRCAATRPSDGDAEPELRGAAKGCARPAQTFAEGESSLSYSTQEMQKMEKTAVEHTESRLRRHTEDTERGCLFCVFSAPRSGFRVFSGLKQCGERSNYCYGQNKSGMV